MSMDTRRHPIAALTLLSALATLGACATSNAPATSASKAGKATEVPAVTSATTAYPSTYTAPTSAPTLIRGATVLTGTGERLDGTDVLLRDGKIAAIGRNLELPVGGKVVDGQGKWVTTGLIDVHSHLGVYASPGVDAHSDGNEATAPSTPQVWAEHSIWPQDPGF